MAKKNLNRITDSLIDIGDKLRIERGPMLKTAKATEALLDNKVTADHYKAPEQVQHPETGQMVVVHSKDALGKPIQLGKPMTYLDWLNRDAWVWYVYERKWEPVLDAHGVAILKDGVPEMSERWVEIGTFDGDEIGAVAHAQTIAGGE